FRTSGARPPGAPAAALDRTDTDPYFHGTSEPSADACSARTHSSRFMVKRAALGGIFLSAAAIGAAYASAFLPGGAPRWAAWARAAGISVMMVAPTALGAARRGRLGALAVPFALVFLILMGGFGVALALPPPGPADATLWLG